MKARTLHPCAIALPMLALAACAAGSQKPDAPAPPTPLPRSSIAAVLAHAGELGLGAAEVERLAALDAVLAKERAELTAEHDRAAAPAPAGEHGRGAPAGSGAPGSGPAPGSTGARPPGQAPGSFSSGETPGKRPPDGAADAALTKRLDEADTRAYLQAEEALAPEHRERAREIASDYRAALFDQRLRERRHR